jgi:hypothetical protein
MLQNRIDQYARNRYAKILREDILAEGIELSEEFSDIQNLSIPKLSLYHFIQCRNSGIDPQESYNRVLTKFLGGKHVVKLIYKINQRFPDAFPKLFLKSFPTMFHWFVGPITIYSNTTGEVLSCTYLQEGGETACVNTCKIPTAAYFKEVLGMDLTLQPNFKAKTCAICCRRQGPLPQK